MLEVEAVFREAIFIFVYVVRIIDEIRIEYEEELPHLDLRAVPAIVPSIRASVEVGCSLLHFCQLLEGSILAGFRSSEAVRMRKSTAEIDAALKYFEHKLKGNAERAGRVYHPNEDDTDVRDMLLQLHRDCLALKNSLHKEAHGRYSQELLRVVRNPQTERYQGYANACRMLISLRASNWRDFARRLDMYEGKVHDWMEKLLHNSYLSRVLTEAQFADLTWALFNTLRDGPDGRPKFRKDSFLLVIWPNQLMRNPSPNGIPDDLRERTAGQGALRRPSPP
ncbi:hypothetical protein RQP46_002479 [Phenoliferia psychrophenolica]